MSQMACDSYAADMDLKNRVLLADSDLVQRLPENCAHVYKLPPTELAKQTTGKEITANVVALGAISVLTQAVQE